MITSVKLTAKPSRLIRLVTGLLVKFRMIVLSIFLIFVSFNHVFKTFYHNYSYLKASIATRFAPDSYRDENLCAPHYSYRRDSTGFLVAALQLCQLTVSNAIPIASIPARQKIHQLNSVL
jgi:hypothetical protein